MNVYIEKKVRLTFYGEPFCTYLYSYNQNENNTCNQILTELTYKKCNRW